jgi:uncharacterized membrane-anchored protein
VSQASTVDEQQPTLSGVAKVDHRTKVLVSRLTDGDIAVIDHEDLDRVAAETLVAARPRAVVNAARSMSGRYPNVGPLLLTEAGIPLIDDVGPDVMSVVEGATISIDGNRVLFDGYEIGVGTRQTTETLTERIDVARSTMGAELERFAENTLTYIRAEGHLLVDEPHVPEVPGLDFRGRHVLIVVRGIDYKEDLEILRRSGYIAEQKPIIVAVDGGADALLEMGLKPDVIIGDFDSVSERALSCGAELVHHVHPDGRAPGRENLLEWGVPYQEFVAEGTSEDVAMLLAAESGARLIVAVGTHASMVEFLDKGRAGMASTFLTRLRLGPLLVDAKGVNRLYEPRLRRRDLLLLVGSALVAMLVIAMVSEPLHVFLDGMRVVLEDLWR